MALKANQLNKERNKKVIKLDNKNNNGDLLKDINIDELIFALDIGTRTVVGIVGYQEDNNYNVVASEILEHENRAMMDGQIHDIDRVADVAKKVKESLEKKLGITLSKVAIAAAGRVLKTCEVKIEREIENGMEITQELISSLEMEGIQKAQWEIDSDLKEDSHNDYYCVGYSIVNYYLNGLLISSLLGHKGKKIGAHVLATFLPHVVVDSLYTVMNKVGLEVESLTLEPIAAINVTIPKDLRLLNLALVDIGAGTSDIAITKDGSVTAYAMAPIAGDEITEKIAQHYLVDFNTGEKIKTSLSTKSQTTSFIDILGNKNNIKKEDILKVIKPTVEILAQTIANKIMEYNQKAPNAVFLIGGGSQILELTTLIADCLGIHHDRVVVRNRSIIKNVKYTGKKLNGPDAITPFGILVTAQMQKGQDFLSVNINGKKVKLFNSKKLTVSDALVLIGYNPEQLIGKSGKSISFELNGEKKIVKGGYGSPAEIFVNDSLASLGTVLKIGDNIVVNAARIGDNAKAKIFDFIKNDVIKEIVLNGTKIEICPKIYINNILESLESVISDGDVVFFEQIETLNQLAEMYEIDKNKFDLEVNGKFVDYNYKINNYDVVNCKIKVSKEAQKIPETIQFDLQLKQTENANSHSNIENVAKKEIIDNQDVGNIVYVNGKEVRLSSFDKYMFVDIFNYIDFDLTKPQGTITLKLNGNKAAFTDEISKGDIIEIYWDK